MHSAVFSCIGLGDGLLSLILSHNLTLAGHKVDTYHPFLEQMQPLFPHLPLYPRPSHFDYLHNYDHLFFIYEKAEWMAGQISYAQKHFPKKVTILNPIATPRCDYPYWEQGRFDGTRPFADNLATYCRERLHIEGATKHNGFMLPVTVQKKAYPKRIIIHPTSSRPGKNWTKERFLKLADQLEQKGYEPVFILTEEEKKYWPQVKAPYFKDLIDLTFFIAESAAMIGNDSGIGHLSSLVGLSTLIICRSQMAADFWRPSWTSGSVIIPPRWIPNLKGCRLRDKKWQFFVPVKKVNKELVNLIRTKNTPHLPPHML